MPWELLPGLPQSDQSRAKCLGELWHQGQPWAVGPPEQLCSFWCALLPGASVLSTPISMPTQSPRAHLVHLFQTLIPELESLQHLHLDLRELDALHLGQRRDRGTQGLSLEPRPRPKDPRTTDHSRRETPRSQATPPNNLPTTYWP